MDSIALRSHRLNSKQKVYLRRCVSCVHELIRKTRGKCIIAEKQNVNKTKAVADYLKSHCAPDARIAVMGSEPEIFFYAHRRSATGHICV